MPVPSKASSQEEEVAQLKQEIKILEMEREELSTELKEYQKIRKESIVSASIYTVCTQCIIYTYISHTCEVVDLFSPLFVLVYAKDLLSPMKQRLKEEGGEGEEPAHKRVKMELPETVKIKLEGHVQVHKSVFVTGWYSLCAHLVMGPPRAVQARAFLAPVVVAFCIEFLEYLA